MSRPVLGVIPARLGSTRLPRKPLHSLAGRPLIEWVWRRASGAGLFAEVVIATDSEEVAEVARGFGATAELTSPDHPSGTDRVAEFLAKGFRFISIGNDLHHILTQCGAYMPKLEEAAKAQNVSWTKRPTALL